MDYRSQIAALAQHVQKDMDYSQIMVAELESGWSISYQQEESYFVADKWFPQISVDKIAGYYPKWAMENAFTNKAGTWRPGTLPPTGDLKVADPGFYACQRYAFQLPLLADIPFVADEAYPVEKATTSQSTRISVTSTSKYRARPAQTPPIFFSALSSISRRGGASTRPTPVIRPQREQ